MRQPVQVAVYCIRISPKGREYLLLRRIPSGGGYWQGISGGVEGNEDYYAAALRELREETGFYPDKLVLLEFSYNFPIEPPMRKLYGHPVETPTEIVFLAVIDSANEPKLDPEEHDAFSWRSYADAIEMLYWSGNREAIKHCERFMQSRGNVDHSDPD